MADPNAQPWTEEQLEAIRPFTRVGRPIGSGKKAPVTLRLDIDVLEGLRATGKGWQTRVNDVMREWLR